MVQPASTLQSGRIAPFFALNMREMVLGAQAAASTGLRASSDKGKAGILPRCDWENGWKVFASTNQHLGQQAKYSNVAFIQHCLKRTHQDMQQLYQLIFNA